MDLNETLQKKDIKMPPSQNEEKNPPHQDKNLDSTTSHKSFSETLWLTGC